MRVQVGNEIVELKLPKFPGAALGGALAAIVLLVAAFGSFYTVPVESAGVVMRFGKHIDTVEPGLHFKVPFGIDRVARIQVRRQMKQEFGHATPGATNDYQFTTPQEQEMERNMLTGDLNAALVEWVVQYRITNPEDFLFQVRNAEPTLRHATESVMREVVGDRTVDEVITIGRQDIEQECLAKLRELVELYNLGITVDQVQLQNVNPPRPVQASFNEVNQAQQEREKAINVANGQYNRAVPQARGEAQRIISEAQGYAVQRVNQAEGEANRFKALFEEYRKAPDVTRRRLYLETMEEVMPRLGKKVVIDESTGGQLLPFLPLAPGGLPAAER